MENKIVAHGCGGQCSGNCGEGECDGCGCDKAGASTKETEEAA